MGKKAHTNTVLSKGGVEEEDRQFSFLLFVLSQKSPFLHLFCVPGKKEGDEMMERRRRGGTKKDPKKKIRKKDREKIRCLFRV